jgi:hypothetical protein
MCFFIFIFYPLVMKAKKERKKGRRHQLKELFIPSFSIVSHTFMHDVRTVPFSLPASIPRAPAGQPSLSLSSSYSYSLWHQVSISFDIYIYHHISPNSFIPSPWQPISKRCH